MASDLVLPVPARAGATALAPRAVAWAVLVAAVIAVGTLGPDVAGKATTAAIYALAGLSLNVILGYIGQLSLGHQGFVGAGALFAAYMATTVGTPLAVAVAIGALAGAVAAVLIGFVALRISGLYLALITLVFGLTLEQSLFELKTFTGGGAGEAANRPSVLIPADRYYFLCLLAVVIVCYLDARMTRSKAGRAFRAIKEDERVAAAVGVNVMGYKLLAFVISGAIAGLAGGLFAFSTQQFVGSDFDFRLALVFVLMTVVGGAGSRSGVVVGSVLFAVLHSFIASFGPFVSFARLFSSGTAAHILQFGPDLIGAFLLLLTLAFNPGGLAQQLQPLARWMTGGPFRERADAGG
jgi:branched-chain amino acid transport system permease protein